MTDPEPPEEVAREEEPAEPTVRAPVRRRRPRRGTFEIGKVFGTSLSVWAKNLFAFVLLSLVVFLPYAVYQYWLQHEAAGNRELEQLGNNLDTLISRVLGMLVAAPLIGAVFAQLRNRRADLGATFTSGLARIPAVIGVALLQGLIYIACFIPVVIAAATGVPAFAMVLGIVSYVALIVASCGLYVAVPAAIVERPGIVGALSRSWRLTNGHKARIFVIFILFSLLTWLSVAAVTALLVTALGDDLMWLWLYVVVAVIASIEAVFMAVIYHDLRIAVDGVDPEEIAAVFD